MPHPHEQKLHEVVNSVTCATFNFSVAAATVGRSSNPLSANPAPAPAANRNRSRRLTAAAPGLRASAAVCLPPALSIPFCLELFMNRSLILRQKMLPGYRNWRRANGAKAMMQSPVKGFVFLA